MIDAQLALRVLSDSRAIKACIPLAIDEQTPVRKSSMRTSHSAALLVSCASLFISSFVSADESIADRERGYTLTRLDSGDSEACIHDAGKLAIAVDRLSQEASLTSLAIRRGVLSSGSTGRLQDLARLRELSIVGVEMSNADLAPLAAIGLKRIYIYDSSIDDRALAHLSECSSLESIVLIETGVAGSGVASLSKLPRLEKLVVNGSDTTSLAIAGISDIKSLRYFEAIGPDIEATDAALSALAKRGASLEGLKLAGRHWPEQFRSNVRAYVALRCITDLDGLYEESQ